MGNVMKIGGGIITRVANPSVSATWFDGNPQSAATSTGVLRIGGSGTGLNIDVES